MTEKDVIFKIYGVGDRPDPNCFCHFGWEGVGGFAFWKYAQAYYDCAEILFVLISLCRTIPSRSLITWSAMFLIASLCVTIMIVLPYF